MTEQELPNVGMDHYCVECRTVTNVPDKHRRERHDGKMEVDIYAIESGPEDGYIARPRDMGHFTDCNYFDVRNHQLCVDCGAVKVPADATFERGSVTTDE